MCSSGVRVGDGVKPRRRSDKGLGRCAAAAGCYVLLLIVSKAKKEEKGVSDRNNIISYAFSFLLGHSKRSQKCFVSP